MSNEITTPEATIRCPFVYSNGKECTGHIVRIEAYKADIRWSLEGDGWQFSAGELRSHYHLFCSEKDNHSGFGRPDSERLKFYYKDLPLKLRERM